MSIKNSHFFQRRHSVPKKILASLVIIAFFFSQTIPSGFADITLRSNEPVVPYVPETSATEDTSNSQAPSDTTASNVQTTSSFLEGSTPLSVGATTTTTQTVTSNAEQHVATKRPGGEDTRGDTLRVMYESLQREYQSCLEEKDNRSRSSTNCEDYLGQLKSVSSAMQDAGYAGASAGKANKKEATGGASYNGGRAIVSGHLRVTCRGCSTHSAQCQEARRQSV